MYECVGKDSREVVGLLPDVYVCHVCVSDIVVGYCEVWVCSIRDIVVCYSELGVCGIRDTVVSL